ncbi:MAG: LysR family transcriptional regulator [Blastocatellia bacterium]|nr:LysR family transcriptional regulator [Blastocatellia bacterium]
MELRHLRYTVTVADELSFSRAAEILHVSQPALSRQVQELEEELGIQIFSRTKRSVIVTDAGRLFLAEARRILAQADQAVQTAARASRGEIGRLVVGVEASSVYCPVAPVFGTYRKRFPKVELVVRELPSMQQLYELGINQLDVGLVVLPVECDDDIRLESVLTEPVYVALHKGHPLAAQENLSLADVSSEHFVLVPRDLGCGFYNQISHLCTTAGFSPKVTQEATQLQIILSFVAAGLGVTLVPASVRFFQVPGIVYLPLDEPTASVELALACRAEDQSSVLQAFLNMVKELRIEN